MWKLFFLSEPYTAAPTACNMSCTFDVDFCEWEQATSDDFDWIRHKGPTPTPNTGPSHDHTTGGRNSKQYLAVLLLEEGKKPLSTANPGHIFPRLNAEPFEQSGICCGVDEQCRILVIMLPISISSCKEASAKINPG